MLPKRFKNNVIARFFNWRPPLRVIRLLKADRQSQIGQRIIFHRHVSHVECSPCFQTGDSWRRKEAASMTTTTTTTMLDGAWQSYVTILVATAAIYAPCNPPRQMEYNGSPFPFPRSLFSCFLLSAVIPTILVNRTFPSLTTSNPFFADSYSSCTCRQQRKQ